MFVSMEAPVTALGDVLPFQFQADPLQGRLLEYLAFAQTLLGQALEQGFGLDGLVAVEFDGLDGGALDHRDDENVVVARHADVIEISGGEEQADELAHGHFIDSIADLNGKDVEHGSGGHPLQPLQADVRNGERLLCPAGCRQQEGANKRNNGTGPPRHRHGTGHYRNLAISLMRTSTMIPPTNSRPTWAPTS